LVTAVATKFKLLSAPVKVPVAQMPTIEAQFSATACGRSLPATFLHCPCAIACPAKHAHSIEDTAIDKDLHRPKFFWFGIPIPSWGWVSLPLLAGFSPLIAPKKMAAGSEKIQVNPHRCKLKNCVNPKDSKSRRCPASEFHIRRVSEQSG
jgi:hypothetical protein